MYQTSLNIQVFNNFCTYYLFLFKKIIMFACFPDNLDLFSDKTYPAVENTLSLSALVAGTIKCLIANLYKFG